VRSGGEDLAVSLKSLNCKLLMIFWRGRLGASNEGGRVGRKSCGNIASRERRTLDTLIGYTDHVEVARSIAGHRFNYPNPNHLLQKSS